MKVPSALDLEIVGFWFSEWRCRCHIAVTGLKVLIRVSGIRQPDSVRYNFVRESAGIDTEPLKYTCLERGGRPSLTKNAMKVHL